jgi:hypothetical protein
MYTLYPQAFPFLAIKPMLSPGPFFGHTPYCFVSHIMTILAADTLTILVAFDDFVKNDLKL